MNPGDTPTAIRPTGMQAMMAYWERLHPVNAVQIAEVPDAIAPECLRASVSRLFGKFCEADPLGRWPSISKSGEFCGGGVSTQFDTLPPKNSGHVLDSLVTRLLNRPFSDTEPPFRVGSAKSDGTNYIWLSYRHSIADARSITLLMQNLLEELNHTGSRELPLGVERTSRSIADLFSKETCQASGLRSVRQSLTSVWNLRRCHRPAPTDPAAFHMTFQVHAERLPLVSLRRDAKDRGVTVGEFVLAAMLEWFLKQDRLQPEFSGSPDRCVSVLVDLTRRAKSKPLHLFGQYLSPVNITANCRRHSSFTELLSRVKATARTADAVVNGLRSLRGLSLNSFLVKQMSPAFANRYQEFLFPISGAFSNVNLNSVLPPPRSDISISNYFRGTCATQLSPMILCLTTIGDTCTLTTTHRDAVYSAKEMRELARHVMERAFGTKAAIQTQAAWQPQMANHGY